MKILLTNDDGYQSPGILALKKALSLKHEVFIVAPSQERSGCSHSLTLVNPVRYKTIEQNHYSCSGTPVDCVLYSLLGSIDFKPDCVVSGINRGPNLGTDILYSGTVAAARQAALAGIPSFSLSSYRLKSPFNFDEEAIYFASKIEDFIPKIVNRTFININFPNQINNNSKLIHCSPARRYYSDELQTIEAVDGSKYYFLAGNPIGNKAEKGSDWDEVLNGNIAYSTVYIDPFSITDKIL